MTLTASYHQQTVVNEPLKERNVFKKFGWKLVFGIFLLFCTITLYAIRWAVFSYAPMQSEMIRFFLGDLGFLCLQILVVTVFLESYFQRRAREAMRVKLNMIIGAFFSETGFHLLKLIVELDETSRELKENISPAHTWIPKDYSSAKIYFQKYRSSIHPTPRRLEYLRDHLGAKKQTILALLANQALLEHEQFTDLLWAITHLAEELEARRDFAHLPAADLGHLVVDIQRAYGLLGIEWLDYLQHLQSHYPYLFSLAERNNPLDPGCNPEVRETPSAGLTSWTAND